MEQDFYLQLEPSNKKNKVAKLLLYKWLDDDFVLRIKNFSCIEQAVNYTKVLAETLHCEYFISGSLLFKECL